MNILKMALTSSRERESHGKPVAQDWPSANHSRHLRLGLDALKLLGLERGVVGEVVDKKEACNLNRVRSFAAF